MALKALLSIFFTNACLALSLDLRYTAASSLLPSFGTSRIFQSTPPEGVTIQSQSETDFYLVNGESEDLIVNYVFMPPNGTSPEQFVMSFGCDSNLVLLNTSCSITNTLAAIVGTDATAYNTTVTCTFERFPAITSCILTANSLARQFQQFKSNAVPVNVYGLVFFESDENGQLSDKSAILSGFSTNFNIERYDRNDQGIREVPLYGIFPDGIVLQGSSAISFLDLANVSVVAEDQIFRYNSSICSITAASYSTPNGSLVLQQKEDCGIGIAVRNETEFPTLGFHLRPYKSGRLTLQLNWDSIGSAEVPYEQVVVFSVIESAPPVITSIEKQPIYHSVPCGVETLNFIGFNFRFANRREVELTGSNGTTFSWPQVSSSFFYNASLDLSSLAFQNTGGLGSNARFIVKVYRGEDTFEAVYLSGDATALLSVDFSSPAQLLGMEPRISEVDGGTKIVLTGTFDGFSNESIIRVGGFEIQGSDVEIESNQQLAFYSPPLSAVGRSFSFDTVVQTCAERSQPIALTYNSAPMLSIMAADSSTSTLGSYIIPNPGTVTFVAQTSGVGKGAMYSWRLQTSTGEEINVGDVSKNEQIFTITSEAGLSVGTSYTLQANVTNPIGLSDTVQITVELAALASEFVLVNIFDLEPLSRSINATTVVQASLVIESLDISDINLVWTYLNQSYVVGTSTNASNSTATISEVTGPAKLGLEFLIARRDLEIGVNQLELTATLPRNMTGRDVIEVLVVESEIEAKINDGLNGTLTLSGSDLSLYAGNSYDPDVFSSDGDPRGGIAYEWTTCRKSLQLSFATGVENCFSVLPQIRNSVNLTITAKDLFDSRLDTSLSPDSTFFVFGLNVSKGARTSETFASFELRTVQEVERVPKLASLEAVDNKGTPINLERTSIFSEIVIQPNSDDPSITWSFDMSRKSQQHLLRRGILKEGPGFVSQRGERSQLPMAFLAQSLQKLTEYTVLVSVYAPESSLVSAYELSFVTSEIPELTCTGPVSTNGIVSETSFTIGGQLSFQAQDIEYCFYLVESATSRFSVGRGCSTIPFATFAFHKEGVYNIQCEARALNGALMDNVILNSTLTISAPAPGNLTLLQSLSQRLANLTAEASYCESVKDHGCLLSLISVVNDISSKVVTATNSETSSEAQVLFDNAQSYILNLVQVSQQLSQTTVYSPNQIPTAIDLSFNLMLVPQKLLLNESTLFAALKQAEEAIKVTGDATTEALVSQEMVDKVSSIANLSLAAAYNIEQEGSSRRRILQETGVTRKAYAVLLLKTTRFISTIRAQQQGCGYSGMESTELRTSVVNKDKLVDEVGTPFPPTQLHIQVSCNQDQLVVPLDLSTVKRQVCSEVLPAVSGKRVVLSFALISEEALKATGLLTDIDTRVTHCPVLEISGVGEEDIPSQCFRLTMALHKKGNGSLDEIRGGLIRNGSSEPLELCTSDTCFKFQPNDKDVVTVTDSSVSIVTKSQGLFTAGVPTLRFAGREPPGTVDGKDSSIKVEIIAVVAIGFIAAAALVTWFSVTHFVGMGSPAPAGMDWEYVERDIHGRSGENENTDFDYRAERFSPKLRMPPARSGRFG